MTFDAFKKLKEENYDHALGYLQYYGANSVCSKSVYAEGIENTNVWQASFEHSYGLSSNYKIYHKSRLTERLLYSREKGSFVKTVKIGRRNKITTPILAQIFEHNYGSRTYDIEHFKNEIIKDYSFLEWVFQENNIKYIKNTLNWLIRRKVSSFKQYLKLVSPKIPAANLVKTVSGNNYGQLLLIESQKAHYWVHNPEHFGEFFVKNHNDGIFADTKRMCIMTRSKVNALWSTRRLREFHDELTKLVNQKKLEFYIDSDILGASWVSKVKLLPGQEIVTSRARLIAEGKEMNHCVASYEGKIMKGECIIIAGEINGNRYTMQVKRQTLKSDIDRKRYDQYIVAQNYGKGNTLYPERSQINADFEALNDGVRHSSTSETFQIDSCSDDNIFDLFD